MLHTTIAKMPEQEVVYFMKRCIDAGLWVPGKNDDDDTKENKTVSDQPSSGTAAHVPTPANNVTDDAN